MVRWHELTNAQWDRIAPLLPEPGAPGGRWADHRTVVNGVPYRTRTARGRTTSIRPPAGPTSTRPGRRSPAGLRPRAVRHDILGEPKAAQPAVENAWACSTAAGRVWLRRTDP
ncbi:transposase [Streptomyces sp. NPDC058157]|uniref:transposase n=1 Tax=Streptomyces sp. NPDC058157 TaxID=3346360 RepID=UPI0036F017BD